VHILSEIMARIDEELRGSLIDDKPASVISDISKIKRFMSGFTIVTPFYRGIRRTLEWFESDSAGKIKQLNV
jgi:hypothetical protein